MKEEKKNKIVPIILVLLILCSAFSVLSAATASNSVTSANTAAEDINIVPGAGFKNPKMESVIAQLVDVSETNPTEVQSFTNTHSIGIVDDKISVVLELTDAKASLEAGYDIKIEASYKNLVQALVPISAIEELAKDTTVQYIRLPVRAYPMITSEGVGVIGADELHALGIKGDDVKIAVIDAGFKDYATNPEIPAANI